jgi:hypothetical protein
VPGSWNRCAEVNHAPSAAGGLSLAPPASSKLPLTDVKFTEIGYLGRRICNRPRGEIAPPDPPSPGPCRPAGLADPTSRRPRVAGRVDLPAAPVSTWVGSTWLLCIEFYFLALVAYPPRPAKGGASSVGARGRDGLRCRFRLPPSVCRAAPGRGGRRGVVASSHSSCGLSLKFCQLPELPAPGFRAFGRMRWWECSGRRFPRVCLFYFFLFCNPVPVRNAERRYAVRGAPSPLCIVACGLWLVACGLWLVEPWSLERCFFFLRNQAPSGPGRPLRGWEFTRAFCACGGPACCCYCAAAARLLGLQVASATTRPGAVGHAVSFVPLPLRLQQPSWPCPTDYSRVAEAYLPLPLPCQNRAVLSCE